MPPQRLETSRRAARSDAAKRDAWIRRAVLAVAVLSGLAAMSIEALPLLLMLLLVLFDRVAHGVMVLLGALLDWLRSLLQAGPGGLPPYRALATDPLAVALRTLLLGLPCLVGLLLIGLRRWGLVLLCWSLDATGAALDADPLVPIALLPGLVAVLLLFRWD